MDRRLLRESVKIFQNDIIFIQEQLDLAEGKKDFQHTQNNTDD